METHTHLIIDSPLPAAGEMIPMDPKHVHLMHGETQSILRLSPGDHTLQLVVGGADHKITMPVLYDVKSFSGPRADIVPSLRSLDD